MKITTGLLQFDFPEKFSYALSEGKFKKILIKLEKKALKAAIKDLQKKLDNL